MVLSRLLSFWLRRVEMGHGRFRLSDYRAVVLDLFPALLIPPVMRSMGMLEWCSIPIMVLLVLSGLMAELMMNRMMLVLPTVCLVRVVTRLVTLWVLCR